MKSIAHTNWARTPRRPTGVRSTIVWRTVELFCRDLIDRTASIGFFQNRHNLDLSEFRLPRGTLLARRRGMLLPEDSSSDLS